MSCSSGIQEVRSVLANHGRIWILTALLVLAGLPTVAAAGDGEPPAPEKAWSAELRVKRYFGSHTSYEFGNPFPPYQTPLSRLEFPLNTWWAGGEFRRSFSRISVGIEVMTNVSRESDGSFKDSDWDDDAKPDVLTIYSESQCRLEPSYMVRGDVDLKVGDRLGMPVWLDLRPVAGIRWQRFNLVAHNGLQTYPAPGDTTPPDPLPGDSISFEQNYWHYFLGMRAAYDLERHLKIPRSKLFGQLDWAYVDGDNGDHHLLREGNRWTHEKTRGDAWHAALGIKAGLTESINAGVEAEYLLIRTTGTHRWVNDVFGENESSDHGVKVWSEQMSLMMTLEYFF